MPHLENNNIYFCLKMSGNLRHIDARQPAQCFRGYRLSTLNSSKAVQTFLVIFFTECRSVKNHIHRELCESFSIVVVVAVLNYSQSPFLYIYT